MPQQHDINALATKLANGLSLEQMREREQKRVEGERPKPNAKEIEYAQFLKAYNPRKERLVFAPSYEQEMPYEEARKKIWAIMLEREAVIAAREPGFQWRFDEEEKERNANILKYFINDKSSTYPLHKGLMLYGLPGTTKTELMAAMMKFTHSNGLTKAFELNEMSKIYELTMTDKNYNPIGSNVQLSRCFDEFLRVDGAVQVWGNPININEAIIEQRYIRFSKYGQITHFIANFAPNDIEMKLSPMAFDRLRQMTTGVFFKGKSKRI